MILPVDNQGHDKTILKLYTIILAEKFLENVERNEGYALMLLKLVESSISSQTANTVIPLAAAISFKNFVKRNWRKVSACPSLHMHANVP